MFALIFSMLLPMVAVKKKVTPPELPKCVTVWNNTKFMMKKNGASESHTVAEKNHIRFYFGPNLAGLDPKFYMSLIMAELKPDTHVSIPDTLIQNVVQGVCTGKKGGKFMFRLDIVIPRNVPKKV